MKTETLIDAATTAATLATLAIIKAPWWAYPVIMVLALVQYHLGAQHGRRESAGQKE